MKLSNCFKFCPDTTTYNRVNFCKTSTNTNKAQMSLFTQFLSLMSLKLADLYVCAFHGNTGTDFDQTRFICYIHVEKTIGHALLTHCHINI